jgi:hypothetical protein
MFKAYELTINENELEKISEDSMCLNMDLWIFESNEQKRDCEINYTNIIKEFCNNQFLDAEKVIEKVFGSGDYDVFLSYSHDDENLVMALAGMLEMEFGLNVFVDSFHWGSADKLLKAIDDVSCSKGYGHYDYKARNLTTSHVHAMLTSGIINVMDRSEIVIFVNTEKSVPYIKKDLPNTKEYTLSPWIYEELQFTKLLRRKSKIIKAFAHADAKQYILEGKHMDIGYPLPNDELLQINSDDISRWLSKYNSDDFLVDKNAINSLYNLYIPICYN